MTKAVDTAYNHIRGAILSGNLTPGNHLREEHLAEICGVSRTPVREALQRLETEQLVRRTPSKRCFVADWSMDDIDEGFQLRAMLESHAAARAAPRINALQIEQLQLTNDKIAHAIRLDIPDADAFASINRDFHKVIIDAAQSERLSQLLASVVYQPVVKRTASHYNREQMERSIVEHEELILAFQKRDATWASSVMGAHIRRAFHSYREAFQEYLKQAT